MKRIVVNWESRLQEFCNTELGTVSRTTGIDHAINWEKKYSHEGGITTLSTFFNNIRVSSD